MDKLPLVARLLLGIFWLVFGLNGFFHFLPMPEMPDEAQAFMAGLAESGYFMTFLKITETTCGFLLLVGLFVPLALTVLAPIVLNILLFHLFLAPGGILPGLIAAVLGIYLAWAYRDNFRSVLQARAKPV